MSGELETKVKLTIYGITAETGRLPNSLEVARKIDIDEADVLDAFARLHAKRLLVAEPGDSSRIRMAPPFSGIATAFPVEANGKRYYANCVWDAYGIAAALHADAIIPASDGHTGEPLTLEVKKRPTGSSPLCRAVRRSRRAVMGQHRLHLSDDAPLPVGRNGQLLV